MLIAAMVGINSRTTMDMDATLRGYLLSEEKPRVAFVDICALRLDDEVRLALDQVTPIRGQEEYGGYRVSLVVKYETIDTPFRIDVTTGDIITPHAIRYRLRSNFENKRIEAWAYNSETILAERVETILRRSVLNTRPRDFYDAYILMKTRRPGVKKKVFRSALNVTSEKRGSLAALQDKEIILRTIQSDAIMRQRWERYCKDNYYAKGIKFDDVIELLIDILQ